MCLKNADAPRLPGVQSSCKTYGLERHCLNLFHTIASIGKDHHVEHLWQNLHLVVAKVFSF